MPLQFRLPKDIPMSEYPKPEAYLEEGRRLTEDAQKQGIVMRVMGPIALHYYFPEYVDLYSRMAAPWRGLVMLLIAIPFLGTVRNRKAIAMSVLVCLGVVFAFHVSDAVLLALGKSGRLWPFLSAWGGNMIFATFALFRLEKANY